VRGAEDGWVGTGNKGRQEKPTGLVIRGGLNEAITKALEREMGRSVCVRFSSSRPSLASRNNSWDLL